MHKRTKLQRNTKIIQINKKIKNDNLVIVREFKYSFKMHTDQQTGFITYVRLNVSEIWNWMTIHQLYFISM